MGTRYFGASVSRREDLRLLKGGARYVDDIKRPGLLHAAVVRSPHAHARILAVRAEAPRQPAGVTAVFLFNDLAHWMKPLPLFGLAPPSLAARLSLAMRPAAQWPLARDVVRYVGEPIAVAVAASRALAEDAAERVKVDYDPLPLVADVEAALTPGAPLLFPEWGDNVAVQFSHAVGDAEGAIRAADVVIHERFAIQRCAGIPLECRGIVADPHGGDRRLSVWDSTQIPHTVQMRLAEALGWPAHRIRVMAPEVGGGFGTKANLYPEEIVIPLVAVWLGQPVKWTEDRREHLVAAIHSREQRHDVEIAATRDGRILALRDRVLVDQGAYNPWGIVQAYNTAAHLPGPYRVPNLAVEARVVLTNKTPHAPCRGAGRPEAVFVMDRALDCLARELALDPAEIRRRNLIGPEEMPYDTGLLYRDGNPLVYDSGDFPALLSKALEGASYETVRAEQAGLRARGIYRGVGISAYVEGTGIGPFESASVRMDPSGGVVVATGACSQGQGHETTLAQLVADALGVPLEHVTVVGGDTTAIPFGVGTFASRSAVVAGNAAHEAARRIRQKLVRAAAMLLEANPDDIEIESGQTFVRGVPSSATPLARVIQSALPTYAGPGPMEADFEATVYQAVPTVTYASAVHVAVVEVDPETGVIRLLRYVVAHDCGRVINPMIVDGQIRGGVAQGIGGALYEEVVYDEAGQLLTGTLMDYLLPTAAEVPPIETIHLESPSPRNPLGIKGVGEGGAIAPPAAIANAVEDALAPFGVRVRATPLSPDRVVALLAERVAR